MKTLFSIVIASVLLVNQTVAQTCNNFVVSFSADGQFIYFSSDRHNPGGNYEIYKSGLDGITGLQRLTNSSVNNLIAKESPDGSKVVWQVGDYGASAEIWMMNPDGTNKVQLTNNSRHDGYPNFSPDGQTIVFEAWDNDDYPEIFTMNTDGTNRTQLTSVSGAYWQSAPIYNPAGNYIYFLLGFNADNHIARMNLDGTNWVDITPPNSFGYVDAGLSFSPDGSEILFLTSENTGYGNGSDIVIADTLGANWNFITSSANGEWFYYPQLHSQNNKIYYSYNPGGSGNWSINEMSKTGTSRTELSSCLAVGIPEQEINSVSVFPNPAVNKVYLKTEAQIKAKVYDLYGRLVHELEPNENDISFLLPGIYIVMYSNNNGLTLSNTKLVKQ